MPEQNEQQPSPHDPPPQPSAPARPAIGRSALVCFGLFGVFFIYYVGAALAQAPLGGGLTGVTVAGMPLGMVLSLGVFPLSWILIVIWYRIAR